MARQVAETITLPDGETYTKQEFCASILNILECCNGFCLDDETERNALADILSTEIMALEGFGPDIVDAFVDTFGLDAIEAAMEEAAPDET